MLTKEQAIKRAHEGIISFLHSYPNGTIRKLKVTKESISYDYRTASCDWDTIIIRFQSEFSKGDIV